jgi:ABC-type Fe3+-siderophore transport system permease subunit
MCELYILLAFGLGLFSGWFANFLLSGKYIEKALDEHYSKEKKEEIRQSVRTEHRKFKLSTAIWVIALFAVFMALVYKMMQNPPRNEAAEAIEKADNAQVFDSLVGSMRDFLRK